ncbi:MAG: hypothetical protein ACI8XX_000476 [Polaribacter sp.]|jgi:hypothetical protein
MIKSGIGKLKIVFWRDIPGQVVIRDRRRSTRLRLSAKFMRAIERAAYRLKKHQKDVWFDPWHDVDQPFMGDINEQGRLLVEHIEQHYSDAVLDQLSRASGKDERRVIS